MVLISSLSASAFYYNGLYFYSTKVGECELRGYDPNYIISSNVTLDIPSYAYDKNNNAYKVTRIASEAFKGRYEIDHLVIPATIESIGAEAFRSCIGIKECILYPSTKVIGNGAFYGCLNLVTLNTCAEEIGDNAFEGCVMLSAVYLGAPMKFIASGAFKGCTALTNVDIPFTVEQLGNSVLNNDGVFEDCLSLMSVTFSYNLSDKKPNIKSIRNQTFKNCINLKRLDFPYSLTYIGTNAFLRCTSLKHLEWGGPETLSVYYTDFTGVPLSRIVFHGNVSMKQYARLQKLEYLKEVRFDKYATEIQENLFSGNKSLTTVHLDKVTKINGCAFKNCTGLKNLTLSPELEEIYHSTFQNCNSLERVTIPDNVTFIGYEAFKGCKKLKDLILGNKISEIERTAFYGCYALNEIVFPMSLTQIEHNVVDSCICLKSLTIGGRETLDIGSFAYNNVPIESLTLRGNVTGNLRNLTTLKSAKFTDYCNTVSPRFFSGCTGLTSVDFKNIKKIEDRAFYECKGLTNVDLSAVEEIGDYAFSNCINLGPVDLSSATSIGFNAFRGCANLGNVKFGDKITEIPDCLGYSGIISLTIPDNVTVFNAPDYCEKLTTVYIGDGVTEINGGFINCNSLDNIWLGKNVSYFKASIPKNLQKITSANPTPPQTSNIFYNVYDHATLIVPVGASGAYKNVNYWKDFQNIKEADLAGIGNIFTDPNATEIKVVNGYVEIESIYPVYIYTLNGILHHQLPEGNHKVNLSGGAYVIKSGNTTQKIIL